MNLTAVQAKAGYTVLGASDAKATPPSAGYRLTGWQIKHMLISGGNYAEIYLIGTWSNQYNTAFDSQGGSSVAPQENVVYDTAAVTEPTTPTRSGYTFGGWYLEAACANVWNFNNKMPAKDLTLYAKWTKNSSQGESSSSHAGTSVALPSVLTDAATGISVDISGATLSSNLTALPFVVSLEKSNDVQAVNFSRILLASTQAMVVDSPIVYSMKLLDQNGNEVTGFEGSLKISMPKLAGLHGTPRVFRYEGSTGTYTDMNAVLVNGFLVYSTVSLGYYAVAGTGDSITLDTSSYTMPVNGSYQIGMRVTGTKSASIKAYSTNSNIVAETKLANGNYQVTSKGFGTAYIMYDVYDNKNKLLTHASVKINVVKGTKSFGSSARQVGIF